MVTTPPAIYIYIYFGIEAIKKYYNQYNIYANKPP